MTKGKSRSRNEDSNASDNATSGNCIRLKYGVPNNPHKSGGRLETSTDLRVNWIKKGINLNCADIGAREGVKFSDVRIVEEGGGEKYCLVDIYSGEVDANFSKIIDDLEVYLNKWNHVTEIILPAGQCIESSNGKARGDENNIMLASAMSQLNEYKGRVGSVQDLDQMLEDHRNVESNLTDYQVLGSVDQLLESVEFIEMLGGGKRDVQVASKFVDGWRKIVDIQGEELKKVKGELTGLKGARKQTLTGLEDLGFVELSVLTIRKLSSTEYNRVCGLYDQIYPNGIDHIRKVLEQDKRAYVVTDDEVIKANNSGPRFSLVCKKLEDLLETIKTASCEFEESEYCKENKERYDRSLKYLCVSAEYKAAADQLMEETNGIDESDDTNKDEIIDQREVIANEMIKDYEQSIENWKESSKIASEFLQVVEKKLGLYDEIESSISGKPLDSEISIYTFQENLNGDRMLYLTLPTTAESQCVSFSNEVVRALGSSLRDSLQGESVKKLGIESEAIDVLGSTVFQINLKKYDGKFDELLDAIKDNYNDHSLGKLGSKIKFYGFER